MGLKIFYWQFVTNNWIFSNQCFTKSCFYYLSNHYHFPSFQFIECLCTFLRSIVYMMWCFCWFHLITILCRFWIIACIRFLFQRRKNPYIVPCEKFWHRQHCKIRYLENHLSVIQRHMVMCNYVTTWMDTPCHIIRRPVISIYHLNSKSFPNTGFETTNYTLNTSYLWIQNRNWVMIVSNRQ